MRTMRTNGAFSEAVQPNIGYTLNLVQELHKYQTDHSGQPYAFHPRRVAANVRMIEPQADNDTVMAALLHDTIEDCGIDEAFLQQKGYSEDCIAMIRLVTKSDHDKRLYEQVIDDLILSGNRNAMIVKLADNMDNLHPERVRDLIASDPQKAQRLGERYRTSIGKLSAALGMNKDRVFELIDKSPNLENMDMALK